MAEVHFILGWGLGLAWAGDKASSWGSWAKEAVNVTVKVSSVAAEVAGAVMEEQRSRVQGKSLGRGRVSVMARVRVRVNPSPDRAPSSGTEGTQGTASDGPLDPNPYPYPYPYP